MWRQTPPLAQEGRLVAAIIVDAPTRLKATTNDKNSGRVLSVRSARTASIVEKIAIDGERGEAGGQIGAANAWNDEDEPEKTEAVQSRLARCASTRSIALSLGQTYAPKQSSHGTGES